MNIIRFLLISVTFIFAAIFTFWFYIWSDEFKHTFFFNDDYLSLIMAFILVIAITGIFKWLLHEEIVLTKPRGKKK